MEAQVIAALAPCYDEPHRHYHDRRHVEEMLAALRFLAGGEPHPALALAAWAHDAVYDPRAAAGDNERASAALARRVCDDVGVAPDLTQEVVDLTLATITHTAPDEPGTPESKERMEAFLDADLWILASPPDRFDEYERDVRAEYAFVPDEAFTRGRHAILAEFAAREHLYVTDRARQVWEPSARSNLARIGHHAASPQRD
ncbi:MAG: hypothetical protein Q4G43_00795 [Mobilicoccus sp.]|nr:hypothetical protein [Mobilicoccus sp.]